MYGCCDCPARLRQRKRKSHGTKARAGLPRFRVFLPPGALDAAAIEVATAGNGHYLAATQNGFVTSGCGIFRVKFALPPQTEAPH
jgi:hypothetical protein